MKVRQFDWGAALQACFCHVRCAAGLTVVGVPGLQVRNDKARRFLMNMRRKPGVNFEQFFPRADRAALRLLRRMLAFDPAERPSSEEALADPYFAGLSQPGREPSAQPVSKLSFDFERRKLSTDEVRGCLSQREWDRRGECRTVKTGLSIAATMQHRSPMITCRSCPLHADCSSWLACKTSCKASATESATRTLDFDEGLWWCRCGS